MNYGKCTLMTLMVCLTSLSASAQQTDYGKMSGWVRQLVWQQQNGTPQQKATQRRSAAKDERHLTAFVQTSGQQHAQLWQENGCRELARKGDIAIVDVPVSNIARLSANPAVRRIEANRRPRMLMDTTRTVVNALPAYTATASHQAFTGKGVILGMMDVGFDLTHPTFYDTENHTCRISALWDQLSPDTLQSTLPVGRDYTTPEEVAALGCTTNGRTQYHGTHTLGIAAGNGYDSPYCGMAPESDICLVCNAVSEDTIYIRHEDIEKYTTAIDALGFKYLFDYADQQGKPCVISFSEGYHDSANEDDRLFAEFMERLTGPGRIIVVAAGNEGNVNMYVVKQADEARAGAFLHTGEKEAEYVIQSDGDFKLHLMVYDADSHQPVDTLTLAAMDGRMDSLLCDTLFCNGDTCAIAISRHQACFGTDNMYVLKLAANRNFYHLPPIAMIAEGLGTKVQYYGKRICSFQNGGFYSDKPIDERWNAAGMGHNLLAPASFPAAISVGSMVHRAEYYNYRGVRQGIYEPEEVGILMIQSSTGPTKDGRTKPDVTAPGVNIISAYSSYFMENNTQSWDNQRNVSLFDYNGRTYAWNCYSGTSMACPVVAGTIALWLEANPNLTRDDIISVFQRTCRHPDTSLSYPNNTYGYGEIDTYNGLLDILGLSGIKEISKESVHGVTIRQGNGGLLLSFHSVPTSMVTVSVYSTAGSMIQQVSIKPTVTEAIVPLPTLTGGIYAIQLSSSDPALCGSSLVRL